MKPVEKIPFELLNDFTLDERIPVIYQYDDATDVVVQQSINAKFNLGELKESINRVLRCESNYYGFTDPYLYQALNDYPVFNKDVALIGSTYPWYEAVLLTRGSKTIKVIEYSDRKLDGISNLTYIKPNDVEQINAYSDQYDAVVSISSYEHDGLGRYGDPLNPNGDLEAMKNLKKIVKPDGLLYLAVPVGQDRLYFNIHRVYGRLRLPLLLKDWTVVETYGLQGNYFNVDNEGDYQPVFVLRNT